MEITDAVQDVEQILKEERRRPTLHYEEVLDQGVNSINQATPGPGATSAAARSTAGSNLITLRQGYPRYVLEEPNRYSFSSTNFDLLHSLFSQVYPKNRDDLISYVLMYLESGGVYEPHSPYYFPVLNGYVSELPLVAEFCIRTGNVEPFFLATAKVLVPTYALALMVMQIEELIALNFDVLSNDELGKIPGWLARLRETADLQTHSARGERGKPLVKNPHYKRGNEEPARQIVKSIDGIAEECKQARYWYLKGTLQRTGNLEIETDKAKVEGFLVKLGFDAEMAKSLNAAEDNYKLTASPFELKNSLGHLRSFLEHLHRESARAIAVFAGDKIADTWGGATKYLFQKSIITEKQEGFSTALYTLISDDGVHPLMAEHEAARLLRNVVIEYGVMFLSALDKRGIKLSSKGQP